MELKPNFRSNQVTEQTQEQRTCRIFGWNRHHPYDYCTLFIYFGLSYRITRCCLLDLLLGLTIFINKRLVYSIQVPQCYRFPSLKVSLGLKEGFETQFFARGCRWGFLPRRGGLEPFFFSLSLSLGLTRRTIRGRLATGKEW